jgi:hypothetical protein
VIDFVDSGVDRTFFAAGSLTPGDRYPEVIRNQVYSAGRVIVVVSRHALQSRWVAREMEMAFSDERPGGVATVIPLALISPAEWDRTAVSWARQLRESVHAIRYWRVHDEGRRRGFLTLLGSLRRKPVRRMPAPPDESAPTNLAPDSRPPRPGAVRNPPRASTRWRRTSS